MSTAFYAGSFNPFTRGHQSIVERALGIFDRVTIAVGYNIRKPGSADDAAARVAAISALYAGQKRVSVVSYGNLTVRAARENGATVLLRGVRNSADLEYERSIAEVNRRLSGIETVLLLSLPEYDCVSSSMVRELEAFGADVSDYLPAPSR